MFQLRVSESMNTGTALVDHGVCGGHEGRGGETPSPGPPAAQGQVEGGGPEGGGGVSCSGRHPELGTEGVHVTRPSDQFGEDPGPSRSSGPGAGEGGCG
jgi:hypothetical protein